MFFRTLPALQETRQWLWIALLVLALAGFSAVRQEQITSTASGDSAAPIQGDFGGPAPSDFGGVPLGGPPPSSAPATATPDASATWTTALLEASGVVLSWFILSILLAEVSLLNGAKPRLGRNLQIAIWSSVPLGLMAALQLLYYAGGGTPGQPGISGVVNQLPGYDGLSNVVQSLLLSLTSRLTLFWLWGLALVYIGARRALRGKRGAIILVLVAWIVVQVIAPVATGAISAPAAETVPEMPTGDMGMPGIMLSPDGQMDSGALEAPCLSGEQEGTAEPDEVCAPTEQPGGLEKPGGVLLPGPDGNLGQLEGTNGDVEAAPEATELLPGSVNPPVIETTPGA